jgi:pyruvate-ferredoxin/flavodoxin oxidoreductase
MTKASTLAIDGNEAAASVAYRVSEIAVIYPITPSSTMGEVADQWASEGRRNIWGSVPEITEMQSEGGAAGACHGAIQTGALGTTFTSSQGLLLMIPNMYKIAGELTPFVIHVAARTVATHALSIFGDHADVMACRTTGFAMLCAASVQEAHDMAAIAHAATLRGRLPFLHFFDGFRTSHEVAKVWEVTDEQLRRLFDEKLIADHRRRALSPDRPVLRGSAQNPDTFFQGQERRNTYYQALPGIVQGEMDRFAAVTGRAYHLFDYVGDPQAKSVMVIMGSGAETAAKTAEWLNRRGEKTGVIKVRLFQPFSVEAFAASLPLSVCNIAVLDRCKEASAPGEPLYLAVAMAVQKASTLGLRPDAPPLRMTHGRYGLASKEFSPAMVKAVFDDLKSAQPKSEFTVGIVDDVTHLSLPAGEPLAIDPPGTKRAVFFGLGADGTVGANKNSIKIVADQTKLFAQGYFVYDSKKSGSMTVSHLRFSPQPIQAPYLLDQAEFVACHHFVFLDKVDVLACAAPGATVLLNAPGGKDKVWDTLPRTAQQAILGKNLKVYSIDANKVAGTAGMGRRTNTIMQTCFFALAGILPQDEAIAHIKRAIKKTYGRQSQKIVDLNCAAVDIALAHLEEMPHPDKITADHDISVAVAYDAPDFVRQVTSVLPAGKGDTLPVSAFPADGTWPTATSRFEKRNISDSIPVWEPSLCIQCNKCAMVCPHAAIRAKAMPEATMAGAPATLKSSPYKGPEIKDGIYLLQVAPEDCTGCTLCVEVCPGKDRVDPNRLALSMRDKDVVLAAEKINFAFFDALPDADRADLKMNVKTSQLVRPLLEFSGACTGCGETPYVKTLTQLFGDRLLIANASGCSSVWGGNLPTVPYGVDREGRGPTWSSSLFEDNAEFGLGYRLAIDHLKGQARALVKELAGPLPEPLVDELLYADQSTDAGIRDQRRRVVELKQIADRLSLPAATRLVDIADYLVDKVVWIVGGDGWAYDIGYGGLDHVLASGRNVNVLVLDTEVYSNTGGQQSKATPIGAAVKFAAAGKQRPKKDLGLIAMTYGNVYVASVAFGAKDGQTLKALQDAASYDGASLVIGYSHCITHGYDMASGLDRQKAAVQSGYWPLYRFDPRRLGNGQIPLDIDAEPSMPIRDFMAQETRFRITERQNPQHYAELVTQAAEGVQRRHELLKRIAAGAVSH